MTPKELQIFYDTIEHVAEQFYRQGQADAATGKSLKTEEFQLSKARKMEIKTLLNKAAQKR